jgi:hypothetical protein
MKNTQKIILSFVFMLSTAFLTHYFFVKRLDSQSSESGRDLASFAERNSVPQIKWEQSVAEELSNSTTTQAAVTKPNWQDLLVYEYLSGHYDVIVRQGQIEALTLQSAMSGVRFQTKDFIEKYGHKIKNFTKYEIQRAAGNNEHVFLFDQSGGPAGLVQIQRDDKGLVQSIQIQ